MSKELLEEAMHIRNYIDGQGEFDRDVEVMDWLIEQAERAEQFDEQVNEFYKLNERLNKINSRYREALREVREYAKHTNYIKYIVDNALEESQ